MRRARRALLLGVLLALASLAWLGWRTAREPEARVGLRAAAGAEREAARAEPRAEDLDDAGDPADTRAAAAGELPPEERAASAPGRRTRSVADAPAVRTYEGLVLELDSDLPVAGAKLVFERAGSTLATVESDAQGRFRTPPIAAAERLRVEPPAGFLCDPPTQELGPQRGDILVPLRRDPATLAGAIRGRLVREAGPWTDATLPGPNSVMLDLVPTSGPKWSRRAELFALNDERGRIELSFAFEDLPPGEYEVTLSSLSAWRWHPASLRVRAPAAGLEFMRYDLDRNAKLVFRVTDRESGQPVADYRVRHLQLTPSSDNGVFLHTGPLDPEAFPLDARFQWSLWADGYRPVFGDEGAFELRGEERVAEVALEKGWATKLLALKRDPAAKPAAGAEVLVDGRSQGFTGTDGMLALHAASEPERIELRLPGWKMHNDPLQSYNGKSAAQRGQVTIVMLERNP